MSCTGLDPFCGGFGGFLEVSKLLRPFSCLLRAPGLAHRHLKINFKPVTVVKGGVMACFY